MWSQLRTWSSPEVLLIVLALVNVCVVNLWKRYAPCRVGNRLQLEPMTNILVVMVSHGSNEDVSQALAFLECMWERTVNSTHVRFHVLHYSSTDESAVSVPEHIRHVTQVSYLSTMAFENTMKAFSRVMAKTSRLEDIVCFVLEPFDVVRGWERAVRLCEKRDLLCITPRARFPCLQIKDSTLDVQYRRYAVETGVGPVVSCVADGFLVCATDTARSLLREPTCPDNALPFVLTARSRGHYHLCALTADAGVRVSRQAKPRSTGKGGVDEMKQLKLEIERAGRMFALGLSEKPSASECISKYGSVDNVRIKLQGLSL